MSKVNTDAIKPRDTGLDITLGAAGDTTVISADSIDVNTVKDSGGNTLWTSDGGGVLSSVNSGLSGSLKLLSTTTADDTSSISYSVSSAYDVYMFEFINIQPVSSNKSLGFQASVVGGSLDNNIPYTSATFYADHNEDDTWSVLEFFNSLSDGNATTYQEILYEVTNDADGAGNGTLFLFNPGSTTFVKHWYSINTVMFGGGGAVKRAYNMLVGAYFNTTLAINAVNFKFDSGNINAGDIKMYGLS